MIGQLEGKATRLTAGHVIISCGGVGYRVAATKETLVKLTLGGPAMLWTHLAVREDSLDLYGFATEEQLRFFELLLMVSGIGPKSALAILDIASVESLRAAISAGNSGYLTKVSGIGRKTAEKIILELRDKVGAAESSATEALSGDEEALEAMRSLGYSLQEARDALRNVPATIQKPGDRVKAALKTIGSGS